MTGTRVLFRQLFTLTLLVLYVASICPASFVALSLEHGHAHHRTDHRAVGPSLIGTHNLETTSDHRLHFEGRQTIVVAAYTYSPPEYVVLTNHIITDVSAQAMYADPSQPPAFKRPIFQQDLLKRSAVLLI